MWEKFTDKLIKVLIFLMVSGFCYSLIRDLIDPKNFGFIVVNVIVFLVVMALFSKV